MTLGNDNAQSLLFSKLDQNYFCPLLLPYSYVGIISTKPYKNGIFTNMHKHKIISFYNVMRVQCSFISSIIMHPHINQQRKPTFCMTHSRLLCWLVLETYLLVCMTLDMTLTEEIKIIVLWCWQSTSWSTTCVNYVFGRLRIKCTM